MRRIIPFALTLLALLCLVACAAPRPEAGLQAPRKSDPLPATPVAAAPAQPRAGVHGVPQLDRSCRVDSDCEVKDVGNCCGYFPACVNASARPDPKAVQAACAQSGMASVCGFREIQACACVSNTCEPAASGGVPIR